MIERIKWVSVPSEDFNLLLYVFREYFDKRSEPRDLADELIELCEEHGFYVAEHNGRRYVFVFVRDMGDSSRYLAGFVAYDKSSRRIIYATYSYYETTDLDAYYSALKSSEPALFLRIVADGRFDVLESLFLGARSRKDLYRLLIPFIRVIYENLGEYFMEYLYRYHRDFIDRFNKKKLIYGRDFVILPMMNTLLIRLNDGSILVHRVLEYGTHPNTVSGSKEPLVHRFLSYLIDSAEELDRNMVALEDYCDPELCYYLILSSASPPHLRGRVAILMMGLLRRTALSEEFMSVDTYLIECDRTCDIYFFPDMRYVENITKSSHDKISLDSLVSRYGLEEHRRRILE
ncbi:MAG: hypothetical protein C0179_03755, partial [Fervidicoccus sp.]